MLVSGAYARSRSSPRSLCSRVQRGCAVDPNPGLGSVLYRPVKCCGTRHFVWRCRRFPWLVARVASDESRIQATTQGHPSINESGDGTKVR